METDMDLLRENRSINGRNKGVKPSEVVFMQVKESCHIPAHFELPKNDQSISGKFDIKSLYHFP